MVSRKRTFSRKKIKKSSGTSLSKSLIKSVLCRQCVETILDNEEWWQFAMQNRTAFNDKDTVQINTPMRKLIRRMPGQSIYSF